MANYTLIPMSAGVSMKVWEKTGLISRELGYYSMLSEHIGPLAFLSYGEALAHEKELLRKYLLDAKILWNIPQWLSSVRHGHFASLFIPPLRKSLFKDCKLVRSNQMSGAWTGAAIARRLGIPFILRCGYNFYEHFKKQRPSAALKRRAIFWIERYVARQADAVIVTFPGLRDYFINRHKVQQENVYIIGNPIDTRLFKPLNITPERDVISIGRLTEQKNYFELIRACAVTGASLTLLGNGHLRKPLARLAAEMNVDLFFHEKVGNAQIPFILARHRLFSLPSSYEGNPKALLEAMACGMPCVASRIEEHAHIISDGYSGLLCSHSARSISNAISRLIKDRELGLRLGRSAREKILKEYSAKENARKEAQIHKALLQPKVLGGGS